MNFYVYPDNFQTVMQTEENKTWVSNSCEKLFFCVWVRIAAANYGVKKREIELIYILHEVLFNCLHLNNDEVCLAH